MERCAYCGKAFETENSLWCHSISEHGRGQGKNPMKEIGTNSGSFKEGHEPSKEAREKMRKKKLGKNNPWYGKDPLLPRLSHSERKERSRKAAQTQWNNPDYIRKQMRARNVRPNNLEKRAIRLIENNNLQFKYVGDGKKIINGKCPDFVHRTQKVVVEVFGTFWHLKRKKYLNGEWSKDKEEEAYSKIYSKEGYDSLFLWEDESDEVWLSKLKQLGRVACGLCGIQTGV